MDKKPELRPLAVAEIKSKARLMRADCLVMGLAAGKEGIHLGGSFSLIEILAALYFGHMSFDPAEPQNPYRDRLILSKGHGVPAQYAAFHQMGLVSDEVLRRFKQAGSKLYGHPSLGALPGIEFSSGSLGQGLSLGAGSAFALKKAFGQDAACVYVILGDGECDEGSVWEAAMAASHLQLSNLIAVVDANGLQYDGSTDEVLGLGSLCAKFSAFGWEVIDVDGHSIEELLTAFSKESNGRPRVLVAHTIKGKGAPFAEGVTSWHHARLTEELYFQGMEALGFSRKEAADYAGI